MPKTQTPSPPETNGARAPVVVPLLDVRTVPIESLHTNPWNPNRQTAQTYGAVVESITTYGFIDPCTVRPHPVSGKQKKLVPFGGDGFTTDQWQIIDSEHRVRAAKELGYTELPINSLGEIADHHAKKLTVILNETRGDPEIVALGALLSSLRDPDDDIAVLLNALPYSEREAEEMLKIGAVDWDQFEADDSRAVEEFARGASETKQLWGFSIRLMFTKAQKERFEQFIGILQREWPTGDDDAPVPQEEIVMRLLEQACKDL